MLKELLHLFAIASEDENDRSNVVLHFCQNKVKNLATELGR
jgi:hypothetical protein